MHNDKLVYKVVICVFLGISLQKKMEALMKIYIIIIISFILTCIKIHTFELLKKKNML